MNITSNKSNTPVRFLESTSVTTESSPANGLFASHQAVVGKVTGTGLAAQLNATASSIAMAESARLHGDKRIGVAEERKKTLGSKEERTANLASCKEKVIRKEKNQKGTNK